MSIEYKIKNNKFYIDINDNYYFCIIKNIFSYDGKLDNTEYIYIPIDNHPGDDTPENIIDRYITNNNNNYDFNDTLYELADKFKNYTPQLTYPLYYNFNYNFINYGVGITQTGNIYLIDLTNNINQTDNYTIVNEIFYYFYDLYTRDNFLIDSLNSIHNISKDDKKILLDILNEIILIVKTLVDNGDIENLKDGIQNISMTEIYLYIYETYYEKIFN